MKSKQEYDVIIFGAGLSGFAAACQLADAGQRVLLTDPRQVLGWEMTWAYSLELEKNISTVADQVIKQIDKVNGRLHNRVDAPVTEMVLDRIAADKNISLLYYTQPADAIIENNEIRGVVMAGKSGFFPLTAKAYIDATEEGQILSKAGIPFTPPQPHGIYTIYMNGIDSAFPETIDGPDGCGNIFLTNSVWKGEIALKTAIETLNISDARLLVPSIIKTVRQTGGELAKGFVSHMAHCVMPMTVWKTDATPKGMDIKNLFAAGPWISKINATANTPAGRFLAGETAANIILPALKGLSIPSPLDHFEIRPTSKQKCEIAVCGGGTAGSLAAIASGRQKVPAVIFEAGTCLGGMATGGAIHSYCAGLPGGIQDDLDSRVEEMTPLFLPDYGNDNARFKIRGFHPEVKKIILEQMVNESGGQTIYESYVTGVIKSANRVTGITVCSPKGVLQFDCHVIIDATGDADVAVMAGADVISGRVQDGITHAYSLTPGVLRPDGSLGHINFDAGFCDPADPWDLTRARCHGLTHLWRDTFSDENRHLYIAPLIGLRNSRHIVGDYQLTLEDELKFRSFDDSIARTKAFYDDHQSDYENESDESIYYVWFYGAWRDAIGCEVPYRCLLPKGIDGIIVACRSLALTHDAHYSLRMERDLQQIGEGGGVAAAQSVKDGVMPRLVNIHKVRSVLFKSGLLTENTDWKTPLTDDRSIDELVEALSGTQAHRAAYTLSGKKDAGKAPLVKALSAKDQTTRFWAAVSLSAMGDHRGAAEVLACVQSRRNDKPEGVRTVPIWIASTILLGIMGYPEAVPELSAIIADKETNLDARIGALHALGRIGDKTAVTAIEKILERNDLPAIRVLKDSSGGGKGVTDDARWQIDLAAARALGKLGKPRPDIIDRYMKDERAYVRRCAEMNKQV